MAIFSEDYYSMTIGQPVDVERYAQDLEATLLGVDASTRRELLLVEIVAITRHVTDGIRDIVRQDRKIKDLVINKGALPLGTWAAMLDSLSEYSVERLKSVLSEMQSQLEHGKIQGFPATMLLYHKPNFVTLEPFYSYIFNLIEQID